MVPRLAALALLFVLPHPANPALASKNVGTRPTSTSTMATSTCETIMVPQWKCPIGKSPGDFACTIILVEQNVCHAALVVPMDLAARINVLPSPGLRARGAGAEGARV